MRESSASAAVRRLVDAHESGPANGVLALPETVGAWESVHVTVHRVGVGEGRAVLLGRYRAARDGSLRDGRVAWVLELRDGAVAHAVPHETWEAGLAATGLELRDTAPLRD